jgi:hypothetical protein
MSQDKVELWSLWVTVIGVIAGIVAAVAAIMAAKFAKDSATKKDVQQVAENTGETLTRLIRVDDRLEKQQSYDNAVSRAQRVSLRVEALNAIQDPLVMRFTVKDPGFPLTRVELFNQDGTPFGAAECTATDNSVFFATVDSRTAQTWYSGGTPDQIATRKLLRLRAFMKIEGQEVYRDLAVHIMEGQRASATHPQRSEQSFTLEGSC